MAAAPLWDSSWRLLAHESLSAFSLQAPNSAVIYGSRINPQHVLFWITITSIFLLSSKPFCLLFYPNIQTKDRTATPRAAHSGFEFRIISFDVFKQHWTTWQMEPDNKSEKLKNIKTYLPFQVKHSWDTASKLFCKRWIVTNKYTHSIARLRLRHWQPSRVPWAATEHDLKQNQKH